MRGGFLSCIIFLLSIVIFLTFTPTSIECALNIAPVDTSIPRGHIVFISIPLPGHVGPLLAQGHELSRRGWRVSIATPSRLQSFIQQRLVQPTTGSGSIHYLPGGDCSPIADEANELFLNCSLSPDFNEGSNAIFNWATRLYPCMYNAIMSGLTADGAIKPSLIVVDAATVVAVDIAHDLGVPYAVNNADLLYLLSPHVLPPFDAIPGVLSHTTQASMKPSHGLLQRVLYPPVRLLIVALVMNDLQRVVNTQRAIVGSKSDVNVFDAYKGKLVLVESAFGLDYPRPLPPLIHMIGPMIIEESLSKSDQEWLDNDSRPVVFVSFGTLAPITRHQAATLIEGLRSDKFRALFKLDKSMHQILPDILPPNVRVESWVSSQQAHLAHEKVKVFISHCGINSAHESVYFGTSLVCIPMFGDQLDMGYRVENAGVGMWLNKLTFNSSQIHHGVTTLIEDDGGKVKEALQRIGHTLRIAGGVNRAAELLEHAAVFGSGHLATADTLYPMYAFYKLDQYAIWIIIFVIIPYSIAKLCGCCCRCCCRRGNANKKSSSMNGNGHYNGNGNTNGDNQLRPHLD